MLPDALIRKCPSSWKLRQAGQNRASNISQLLPFFCQTFSKWMLAILWACHENKFYNMVEMPSILSFVSDDDCNFRSKWITARNKLIFCVFTAQPLCAYFPGAVPSSNNFSNIKAHLCCFSVVYAAGEDFTCKTAHLQHTEKPQSSSLSIVLLPSYTVKVPSIFLDIDVVFCSVGVNCCCLCRTLLDR